MPLDDEALITIKNQLARASLHPVDESIPFTVETDTSDFAIAATLNQNKRPVAFHVRTLSLTEQKHSAIEKGVCDCRSAKEMVTPITKEIFQSCH